MPGPDTGAATGTTLVQGESFQVRRIDYDPPALNPLPSRRYYFYLMAPAVVILACITIYPFLWLI